MPASPDAATPPVRASRNELFAVVLEPKDAAELSAQAAARNRTADLQAREVVQQWLRRQRRREPARAEADGQ